MENRPVAWGESAKIEVLFWPQNGVILVGLGLGP